MPLSRLRRYYPALRLPPARRTGLGLPSPRPFHDCIAGFAPRDCRCLVAGPGCCLKRPPAPRHWPRRLPLLVCPWKQADLPSSRRNPCRCAHAPSTPEDPGTARPYRCAGRGHGDGNVHGFFERLSRLNRMALRLAVYASHRHVAVRHARLASGCVGCALPGGACTHWVSQGKVSVT